jgi:tRNA (cytidine/uridine-2'-O-)-methyltransferase
MEVALYCPQIPQNTGSVARSCAAMNVPLHLIRPFPFDISEAKVKRAGLDYWPFLSLHVHESEDAFFESMALRRIWVLENFGNKLYSDTEFQVDDVLLFGGEIKGVPREVIANRNLSENVRRIPMLNENVRSLNLSNSVAIVLFEGLRQIGF